MDQAGATMGRMRRDVFGGSTSSATTLRRAKLFHLVHEARGLFARVGLVATAAAEPRPAATPDRALWWASPDTSRTQRHLEVLGVGVPPDRGPPEL
jgi:hypothetical protein